MAAVKSLGIHRPSALPYLVDEGILSPDAPESEYTWQTIPHDEEADGEGEEELLTTQYCVVLSRAGVIRRLFRFEIEKEAVVQAILTRFSTNHEGKLSKPSAETPRSDLHRLNQKQQTSNDEKTKKVKTKSDDSTSPMATRHSSSQHAKTERALVVILKTQAHIFFLQGTSHVVHLPFEVSCAMPLPSGLLLQRKLQERRVTQQTPVLPSVPPNSFARSNTNLSWTMPSSQPLNTLANSQSEMEEPGPFDALFKTILAQATYDRDQYLPRHYCLTDPLTEMGIVASDVTTPLSNVRGPRRIAALGTLDPNEEVLYVSLKSELEVESLKGLEKPPLMLALTKNCETQLNTLWAVSYPEVEFGGTLKSRPKAGGSVSRRRTSYGPGTATGTSTPAVRNSLGPVESFLETLTERNIIDDETNLAAQLDSAFENPSLPAKASRRVSSLLARSDLSTSHDRSMFPDLAVSHITAGNTKRGPSLGAYPSRTSFGAVNSRIPSSHKSALGSQSGESWGDSQATYDIGSDDDLSTLDGNRNRNTCEGLRTDMILTKVHSFLSADTRVISSPRSPSLGERVQVFTFNPPTFYDTSADLQLVICMLEPHNHRLSILQALIKTVPSRKEKSNYESNSLDTYRIQITQSNKDGILGACKVTDDDCTRLLVLSATQDGLTELTLQTPWSTLKRILLPGSLLVHHPFRLAQLEISQMKRQGGLKRVLSEGPGTLLSVDHSTGLKDFSVLDSRGLRHRIEIQMRPKNHLVKSTLDVCEAILPHEGSELEPLTRAWWDVMSWLQCRSEGIKDIEWTSFVVLIFSMFVPHLDDPQTQSILRQKKRKAGLLRSSSGASGDLDNFNRMMALEGNNSGSSPIWLQGVAWAWCSKLDDLPSSPLNPRSKSVLPTSGLQSALVPKSTFLPHCALLAREFAQSTDGLLASGRRGYLPTAMSKPSHIRRAILPRILIGLHLYREELKLNVLAANDMHMLTPVVAQLGGWLDWESWSCRGHSYYMLESADMEHWLFDRTTLSDPFKLDQIMEPPSIFRYMEDQQSGSNSTAFTTLSDITSHPNANLENLPKYFVPLVRHFTPRTSLMLQLFQSETSASADNLIETSAAGLNVNILESLPEGIAAPLKACISSCQADPVSTWPSAFLQLIDREDIGIIESTGPVSRPQEKAPTSMSYVATRDFHAICNSTLETDPVSAYDGAAEADRQSVTRMIFKDDQRFSEAMKLLHPLKPAVACCVPEPDWSDTDLLEAQQELVKIIAVRTLAVSAGRGMMFFNARCPLLTERFPIHCFTLSCVMKPANITVTADKSLYTEEKVSWAFFHAGVEAGLSISKSARGINTSWILFNKPPELGNRHAGFLLALGLNGHLKSIAKWVAFKYLTPKHTMTSIGLLLGLAASYLGTMDTLITRLLSVHVTRMLPAGAAELNLAPLTQTTGIMAIGLLYANTQHRRMSEIMLSEMENIDQDENASPMDSLRDEGYRLAAGFALGYINIGHGKNLKGLHDMHIVERLLALAIGTRQVDLVHILDKATAAAVIAVMLIFMKTHDEALARKIDIPDTTHQFEYVRPDIFLLRTVARHLIMWDQITATTAWMRKNLPLLYQPRLKLIGLRHLATDDMPLLNIVAGLCFSIGLRFAGTARQDVRNLLGYYLDQFIRICRLPAVNYDGKLARNTARNCQDVVALAAASVMAGTGDLYIFRRLRSLHARSDPETPYGSHLATHMAIGVLFLAGGTHSFSTSNLAIASLICAFYPLFPTSVQDNKSHLQAFRHFWVLAAEPRCLVIREADTHRPITMSIIITLRSGTELSATAPCMLPELESISKIQTDDPDYWRVTLNFATNPAHLPFFKQHQSMFVRCREVQNGQVSTFSATLKALNGVQLAHQATRQIFEWVFDLPAFQMFDKAERSLILPTEGSLSLYNKTRTTAMDDKLVLQTGCLGNDRAERLWNLRLLFAWADSVRARGGQLGWFDKEAVENLRAAVLLIGLE
jgi:anaphase-promoting complex subunit 1